MIMEDEELLLQFVHERKLSQESYKLYKRVIESYTEFHETSFYELLEEADNEEEERIRMKNRKIKKRLTEYRNYLIDNYTKNTVLSYFSKIKTLYSWYELELPNISNKTKQIKQYEPIYYRDLPDKEIIKEALKISNSVMKAIILFMSSSGCARKETLNITIEDFIEATKHYHNLDNIYEILDVLKKQKNIIPTWKIRRQKTNKYYYTFCSYEATEAIVNYLYTRTDDLTNESKLFKISANYFITNFIEINNNLRLGQVGPYNRFRSHMLRKFHASNLLRGEFALSIEDIDSLQGRSKNQVHESYFFEDPNELREKYIKNINQLLINYEVVSVDSPEVLELKYENNELKKEREELIEKTKEENKEMVLSILKDYGLEVK